MTTSGLNFIVWSLKRPVDHRCARGGDAGCSRDGRLLAQQRRCSRGGVRSSHAGKWPGCVLWVRAQMGEEQPVARMQRVLCGEVRRVPWGPAAPRRGYGGFIEEVTLTSSEG